MDAFNPKVKNRRISARRKPRPSVKVACYRGTLDLGKNLAVSLVDISETGLRLVVSAELPPGQPITVLLQGPLQQRPLKLAAHVVWGAPAADGNFSIGVQLEKYLRYQDILELT